jgi:hypothetical protein
MAAIEAPGRVDAMTGVAATDVAAAGLAALGWDERYAAYER